ncbi:MAG: glycosyltransferase family 2 protein, partial [Akkermansiaceae bacterium]
MFSILILTKDEEINIRDCMDSVAWCDDVVVLDSLSDDSTCKIAGEMGARIYERPFDDFGSQR